MRVALTCVCSAMYPCVGLLVSCVFGPCPAKSLCAYGVLLSGHRPLVVCTILLSLSVHVAKEDAVDIAVHLSGCVLVTLFIFILHVPLLVVILHAFFHIYSYCTKLVNNYNYCFILRWFGFFNVATNFVKRKCVYKFNKVLIVFPY